MLLGVVGDPILHSLSPSIHAEALKYHKQSGAYLRILPDSIESAILFAKELGIKGLNITAPFKEKVCRILTESSDEVSLINACNTLLLNGEEIIGSNTDHTGVVEALEEEGIEIFGKNALVLGLGGAGRGAVFGLIKKGASVSVLNRSHIETKLDIKSYPLNKENIEREVKKAQIIINTLPVEGVLDEVSIKNDQVILDANYNCKSRAKGRVISGERWLIYQGAISSEVFLGKKTPIQVFEKGLLKSKFSKKIAFIGMMGSGKTSVGKEFAKILNKTFSDSDEEIEREAKRTVLNIFNQEGERKFRELEKIAVFDAIEKGAQVLSLGGGATEDSDIFKVIKEEFLAVWIWAPKEISLERIGQERPLKGMFEELLDKRAQNYGALSDLVIADSKNSPEFIAKKIISEIEKNQ